MDYYLAPLADFTSAPFRLLCANFGAARTYTEMVSAAALAHGHAETRFLMETLPGEAPVACQLFGGNPDELAFAAREVERVRDRFCELNLNAGCPMPRILRADAGARLAEDPARIHRLLCAMKAETSLPVTLKTRLGPDERRTTIFEIADAAARAGASALILHARYTSQMHHGPVHLDLLAEVVRRARIPVVGNGAVRTAADAAAMAQTGVAAIMVGRGALARPWVFRELARAEAAVPEAADLARRHLALARAFRRRLAERHPTARVPDADAWAALIARTHLFRYFTGIPNAAALRRRFASSRTLAEVEDCIATGERARGFAA